MSRLIIVLCFSVFACALLAPAAQAIIWLPYSAPTVKAQGKGCAPTSYQDDAVCVLVGHAADFRAVGEDKDMRCDTQQVVDDPLTYQWTFGDGSGGSGQSVTHIYATPGQRTVRVVARDNSTPVYCNEAEEDDLYDEIQVNVFQTSLEELSFLNDQGMCENSEAYEGWYHGAVIQDPVWVREPAKNEPASYVKGSTVTMRVLLEHQGTVSPAVSGTLSCSGLVEASESTSLSGAQTQVDLSASSPLDNKAYKAQAGLSWHFTCEGHPGNPYSLGTTGQHALYVVWGPPTGSDWVTPKRGDREVAIPGDQGASIHGVADHVHGRLDADPPYDDVWGNEDWDWRLLVTYAGPEWEAPYRAECKVQAMQMARELGVVGIPAANLFVWEVYPSKHDDEDVDTPDDRPCPTQEHGVDWLLAHGPGADDWNEYEGVCYVKDAGDWKAYAVWPSAARDSGLEILRWWVPAIGAHQCWA